MKKTDAKNLRVSSPAKKLGKPHEKLAKQTNPSVEDVDRLRKLVALVSKQTNPSVEDVDRLRKLVVSMPAAWILATDTMHCIRKALVEKISTGATRSFVLAELDILAKQLGFDTAPPIERLLIDHILTVMLRLIYAEHQYNQCVVNQSIPLETGVYWDNLLSSNQARFLRGIEALARVRRLARNRPALQINIAREGGQQVNVQGEVDRKKIKPIK